MKRALHLMGSRDRQRVRTLASHFSRSYRLGAVTLFTCLTMVIVTTALVVSYEVPRASKAARAQRLVAAGHEALLQQQTSFRGFLLTRDEYFLAPYRQQNTSLRSINEALTRSIDRSQRSTEQLLRWRLTQQAWTELAENVLGQMPPAEQMGATLRRTDEAFNAYQQTQDELAATLEIQRVRTTRETYAVAGVPAVVVIVLLTFSVLFLRRERHSFDELVLAPVAQMEQVTRSVAEGNLSVKLEPTGVDDLRKLGEDINLMTDALAVERENVRSQIQVVDKETGQLRALLEFVRSARTHSGFRELCEYLCSEACGIVEAEGVVLLERIEDGELKVISFHGSIDLDSNSERILERAAETGRTVSTEVSTVVPLVHAGRVMGLMQFLGKTHAMELELIELIALQSAVALEAARSHDEIEYLSEHDPLTEAMNRRRFDADLELELQRAARYGAPVTLIMIDLDYFKSVNDRFGHHVGDRLLHTLAHELQRSLRATDSAYRYGGEEFAIIARQTDRKGCVPVATRIKSEVQERLELLAPIPVTLSIGIASAPEVGHSPAEIIARADAALYKAKELGRNRVIAAKLSDFIEAS